MLPAGKYYIGTLTNVLSNEDWNQITHDGELVLKGNRKIAVYTTSNQDYCFWDIQGRCYIMNYDTVFGCIKVDDIQELDADFSKGHIVDFDEDFETEMDGFDICFGRVIIETEPEQEEEYDDDEEIIDDDDDDYYDDEDEEEDE